ncbi:MAG: deacylase [Patescibacteria group bacterium]|nr:MAG: deacylase [Patescibacteria group bacterium]
MNLEVYHPTVQAIVALLEKNNIRFETFEHEPVRTSEEAAQVRTGYSLQQGAKALILRIKMPGNQNHFAQFVVPGDKKVNSKVVTQLLGAKNIRFAHPEEIAEITQGIEIGGIPPFGNLFGLSVYVDTSLLKQEKIIFNAGDRSFSIGMKLKDYLDVVKPIVITLT